MNYSINLLPEELKPRPLVDKKRIGVTAVATLAGALLVLGGGIGLLSYFQQRMELSAVSAQVAYLQPAVHKYDAEKAQELQYRQDTQTLQGLVSKQMYWEPVLDQIEAALPVDVWLDSLDVTYVKPSVAKGAKVPTGAGAQGETVAPSPNALVVKGRARSFSSIGVFEDNLSVTMPGAFGFTQNGRPLFNKVTLDGVTENGGGEWTFTLTCQLNPV